MIKENEIDSVIGEVLRDFRCQYSRDYEREGLPLLDMLCPREDRDVARGKEELEQLRDELTLAIIDLVCVKEKVG